MVKVFSLLPRSRSRWARSPRSLYWSRVHTDDCACRHCAAYASHPRLSLDRALPNLSGYCLCQDCLAVYPFTVARHVGLELCRCGGDLCGCDDCSRQAVTALGDGPSGTVTFSQVRDFTNASP